MSDICDIGFVLYMYVKLWLSVILFAYYVSAKNTTELIYAERTLFKHCMLVVLKEHRVDECIDCSCCNTNL